VFFGASDEQSLLASTLRKLNVNKVIFVGDGRVGKTSLLRLLRGDLFNESELSTCGVELCTVKVGAGEWAEADLATVGDVAGILAGAFQRPAPASACPPTAFDRELAGPAPAVGLANPPASGTAGASSSQGGPIIVTSDLPELRCVEEGSVLSLLVRVSGGTPNEPLQYLWSCDGDVVDGQASNELRIGRADSSWHAGRYQVEIWCASQPTRVRSSVVEVMIVPSISARVDSILLEQRVNSILLEQGERLTDDSPRAIFFDFAGQRMYYALQRLLLTGPLTVYIVVVSLADDLDAKLACPEDLRYDMTHRENLFFWLRTIYGHAPEAKIIVVGSKADGLSKEMRESRMETIKQCVEVTLSGAKDMVEAFVVVSSKTGEGVKTLRSKIDGLRLQLNGYGAEVPVGWFKFFSIAQELVMQDQPRISYAEAQGIALACEVQETALDSMLELFSQAGLLL
jgi:GTPase SAR1 family protein